MNEKKERRRSPSSSASEPEDEPERSPRGGANVAEGIANTKMSRRTVIRGTVAAAAVVGVTSVAAKERIRRAQPSSSSSESYVTISPTVTNTATVPPEPPLVTTDPFGLRTITLNINGTNYSVNVEPRDMLVDVIRDHIGLIATKKSCDRMQCGVCTVLIDGVPHESCSFIALRAVGHKIVTSEVAQGDPVVNALQEAWVEEDGGQCTYCGSGQIMAATALLKSNTNPTIPEIKAALSGNLCRCGNYMHIIAAVQTAAKSLGGV